MTTLRDLGELGLLSRLLPHLDAGGGEVVIGAGADDVAVWKEGEGRFTVATCDTFVEGVHFDPEWMDPVTVGWRAVALTLADLGAKGARPTYGLVTLSASPDARTEVIEDLYTGLGTCAVRYGLRLVGGDTTRTSGPVTITVCALGTTARAPQPRSAVRPGWTVGVTGPLGAEAAALAARRATRPEPWGFGDDLGEVVRADISDGLLRELVKFGSVAGVGARVRLAEVPVAAQATVEQALLSGEEVQYVCAWPAAGRPAATPIGEFTAEPGIIVVKADGTERRVSDGGFDHFA